jgi:hypothetical protein
VFGRLKLGSALTVALSVCLVLVRLFLLRGTDMHGLAPHAGFMSSQPANPVAPTSSWVVFATTDQATQVHTQHARIRAEQPPAGIQPEDYLELTGVAHGQAEAVLTLASVPASTCPAIDHIAASFDSLQPHDFTVQPTPADGTCRLQIATFDLFLDGLLNAQTLAVTPKAPGADLKKVAFPVAGLTWITE